MERPIILKAHEVRGILSGNQTQLRRIIKHKEFNKYPLGVTPHGQVGDRLWGRETWAVNRAKGNSRPIIYAADLGTRPLSYVKCCHKDPVAVDGWNSSSHMPRSASRILLEIVSVRVERLQDISAINAIRNGIRLEILDETFPSVWVGDYGQASWDSNPWVWVVEFKRVDAA